jgi:DNA-binding CsgD family transcriptional regulator
MQHLILAFYVLFFATGFMGVASLAFLRMRSGERLLDAFLAFQVLFIAGLALVGVYFYVGNVATGGLSAEDGLPAGLELAFSVATSLIMAAIYLLAIGIMLRLDRGPEGRRGHSLVAAGLSAIAVAQSLAAVALAVARTSGSSAARRILAAPEWSFGAYVLTALAIGAFGFIALGAGKAEERPSMRGLLRGYAFCALAFAPLGLAEWALNRLGFQPWRPLSLDYLFYLGWNLVSVAAFTRSLGRADGAGPLLDAVPDETAAALGLTGRERDMALMIARGLANKEIAAELGISPATVRTHIYNLYRKAGASSRVELIRRLRS